MTNNIVSTKDIWKWVGLGWCTTCCGLGFKKLTHVHVWFGHSARAWQPTTNDVTTQPISISASFTKVRRLKKKKKEKRKLGKYIEATALREGATRCLNKYRNTFVGRFGIRLRLDADLAVDRGTCIVGAALCAQQQQWINAKNDGVTVCNNSKLRCYRVCSHRPIQLH